MIIPIKIPPDAVKSVSDRYFKIYEEQKKWSSLPRFNKDHITTQDVLKALLTTPKTKNQQLMKDFLSKPEIIEETLEKTTKQDFRAFLRDMLDEEKENIPESLHNLREQNGEAEYQRALQSWAKIALPSEKDVNVDVNISQRISMNERISKMYGYSQEIENTHHQGQDISMLQAPTMHYDSTNPDDYACLEDDSEYETFNPCEDESSTYDGVEEEDDDSDHPHPIPIKLTTDNQEIYDD